MNFVILLVWILVWSLWAVLIKMWMGEMVKEPFSFKFIMHFFMQGKILAGMCCYFLPIFVRMYLLRLYPLSYLQPILALTYATTPLLALMIIKEPVPTLRWIGIAVIIIGVFIVSKS